MAQWLVGQSSLFGVHFQNWMPVVIGIAALFVLYSWIRERMR
jgi:hypothetical protein